MPRVSVITLHDVANYGSCLQAYATQVTFGKLGWTTEIVDYHRPKTNTSGRIRSLLARRGISENGLLFRIATAGVARKLFERYYAHGNVVFDKFRRNQLRLSDSYSSEEELEKNPPLADVYCTGSDQVWNSIWNEGFESPLYLTWAPKGKPRIAFAASIGREKLDEWEKPLMEKALREYTAISMRETTGVKLIEELGIEGVKLVLDPTLMLTKQDWEKIATYPKMPGNSYILSYQLNQNEQFVKYARELGHHLGLPVVKICYRKRDRQAGAINLVTPEVTDFLGLFLGASYVVTDSFHATAFSLNLEKPFVSIAPTRFSTRITSILELTGTHDRLLRNYEDLELMEQPIDFHRASHNLIKARESSFDYLKQALPALNDSSVENERDETIKVVDKVGASC
ncbi:polysaccharide pyruvyl transferase family protein [Collinsella tanakaei]|nr:polysaccharide pyruvyl transferase family protein [Collinsella tanakaei]